MIKSEVKEKEVKETKPFPKLMINKDRDIILLATQQLPDDTVEGTVIGGGHYRVGNISNKGALSKFEDFHGSITLTQE